MIKVSAQKTLIQLSYNENMTFRKVAEYDSKIISDAVCFRIKQNDLHIVG